MCHLKVYLKFSYSTLADSLLSSTLDSLLSGSINWLVLTLFVRINTLWQVRWSSEL